MKAAFFYLQKEYEKISQHINPHLCATARSHSAFRLFLPAGKKRNPHDPHQPPCTMGKERHARSHILTWIRWAEVFPHRKCIGSDQTLGLKNVRKNFRREYPVPRVADNPYLHSSPGYKQLCAGFLDSSPLKQALVNIS